MAPQLFFLFGVLLYGILHSTASDRCAAPSTAQPRLSPPYMLHCPREEYENVHRCIMEYGIQMRLVNIPIACTRITLPRRFVFFQKCFFFEYAKVYTRYLEGRRLCE